MTVQGGRGGNSRREQAGVVHADRSVVPDETLARLAATGDLDAMDELLRRNVERVHAICRRITCHPEDAKDAAQEALVAIHRNVTSFDGRSTFATWMHRVATNAALVEVRRRGRRPVLLVDVAETAGLGRAVVLRDLCDLDYPTIAAVLDLPEGTVRSRIHRGRKALRASLTLEPTN